MAVSDTVASLGQLGMGGLQLLMLRYGRDAEREADELGYKYAINTGYDVRAMPGVFATLKRVGEAAGAQKIPSWLSTHPEPDERMERINQKISQDNPPTGKIERENFLALTNNIVYGPDPRNGFFEGDTFKHPQMKFQLQIPAGWKKQNLAQAVVAQSADGKGGFQLTLAKEGSPSEALQKFSGNQAITNLEKLDLPFAVPGTAAKFVAKTEEGQAQGIVAFVTHGGKTFQMLGLGAPATFSALEPAIRATQASFAPLNDPAALQVQPARVKLVTVPQTMTFAEFARSYSNLPADRLAILNQVEAGTRLEAGAKMKVVEGKVRSDGSGS
jgi:predicted Zn-dependent protease